ncbi:MAG: class I SAM-dependent methyltransferase [Candidatus Micrarchaeota archaeon]|nr:methyltransferase domain-containing protein [Patescibacteria group bacterium]
MKIKLYEKWANVYDENLKIPSYQELINNVISEVDPKDNERILDVGIGTGIISLEILHKADCNLIGIDISPDMVQSLLKKCKTLGKTIDVQIGSVLNLDSKVDNLDKIVASLALHHLSGTEKYEALQMLYNRLNNNGKIIIAELDVKDENSVDRLKKLIEIKSFSAIEAYGYAGSKLAEFELEMLLKIFKKDGEYPIGKNVWCDLLNKACFKDVNVVYENKNTGYFIVSASK